MGGNNSTYVSTTTPPASYGKSSRTPTRNLGSAHSERPNIPYLFPDSPFIKNVACSNHLEVELKLDLYDGFDISPFFDQLVKDLSEGGASITNIVKENTTTHTFYYSEPPGNPAGRGWQYEFSTMDGRIKKKKSPTQLYSIGGYVFALREEVFSEIFPAEVTGLKTREVARTRSEFSVLHNGVGMFVCFDKCLCNRNFMQQVEIEIKSGNTRSIYGLHQTAKQVLDFADYLNKLGMPLDNRVGRVKYEWARQL